MSANQIQVTEGSGKNVSTETIGTLDYQKIKITDGTVGSSSMLAFVNNGTAIPVSVMGAISATLTGNTSVSGTVGSSIIGLTPVSITNTVAVSVLGSVPITGNVGITSVIGAITPYAQPNSLTQGVTSIITTTSSVLVLSAPTSPLTNYITHILATNGGSNGTYINIIDSGNVIYSGFAAGSGGGFSATLPAPLKQPTSSIGLYAAATTASSILVAVSGYKAP